MVGIRIRLVRHQNDASLKTTFETHRKKLEKLFERQDKLLGVGGGGGGRNERQLKVLVTLNCLNVYMKCCHWVRSIQLETSLTRHLFG